MPPDPGMLQPDLVRHLRRLDVQRSRLEQLEATVVKRPFDLHRLVHDVFSPAHPAAERRRLAVVEAGLTHQLCRVACRRRGRATPPGVAVILAPSLDRAHKALAREYDALRTHLPLRDG